MADWTSLGDIDARVRRIEKLAQSARREVINAQKQLQTLRSGAYNGHAECVAIKRILHGLTVDGTAGEGTISALLAVEVGALTDKTRIEVSPLWDERIDSITITVNAGGLGKASITANCSSYPDYEPFEGFLTGYKVKLAGCSVAGWNDVEYTIHALEVSKKSFLLTTTLSGTDKTETGITVYREA